MNLKDSGLDCQIPSLQSVQTGLAELPPQSLLRRLKLLVRRRMTPSQERTFKRRTNNLLNRFSFIPGGEVKPAEPVVNHAAQSLQAGDWVRVRSIDEIQATLNHWRQRKGCTFMPEMAQYCSTTQRVLKPMLRFVDERDLKVKRSSGIILLDGVMCQGTAEFGSCDRSCFYFWREEWLEKIDGSIN
jgi:hypothetical protein